jgi:hypothetical protein
MINTIFGLLFSGLFFPNRKDGRVSSKRQNTLKFFMFIFKGC